MLDLERLEPGAVASTAGGQTLALFSIAISLKRIADEIAGQPDRNGLTDSLWEMYRAWMTAPEGKSQ